MAASGGMTATNIRMDPLQRDEQCRGLRRGKNSSYRRVRHRRIEEAHRPAAQGRLPQVGQACRVSGSGVEENVLLGAVTALRAEVAGSRLPLDLAETKAATAHREALLHQLDDYVLPRLSSLDAPLLAVIGGSTGARQSTLVGSVVDAGQPLRGAEADHHHPRPRAPPRRPEVVHRRPRAARPEQGDRRDPGRTARPVRLVGSRSLPPGLAMLDAPDIDSVVSANRALASQLLAAADLWLFVTTAARYADAVPWALLREASDRGTAVAIGSTACPSRGHDGDPVPPRLDAAGAGARHRPHLRHPGDHADHRGAPAGGGRRSPEVVARYLASDARARASVVKQTLGGALDSASRTGRLVHASQAQHDAHRCCARPASRPTPMPWPTWSTA